MTEPSVDRPVDPAVRDHVMPGGWYTLGVLLALTLFGFIDRQVLTLAAAPLSVSLTLSDSELGMVQGLAFAIFSVVAVYPIAWAADRFDRRIVLAACLLTWSIGTAACGLAQSFTQLFAAAVLIAAGEAGLLPIITAAIPELFKGRKRLLANGLVYIFAFLGVAAGLAVGGKAIGALSAAHGGLPEPLRAFEPWRLAFFAVALPAPVLLVLLVFTRLRRSEASIDGGVTPEAVHATLPFLRQHRGSVAPLFLGMALYMLAFSGFLVWLPVAATRIFGTTPEQNGVGMGMATAIGMVGGVATGTFVVRRLITRMGPVATIRFFWITMLLSFPIVPAFSFVGSANHAFVLFALLMMAGTAIGCMVPTMLQDLAPAGLRARLAATWAVAAGLIGGSAPSVVGWTSDALGGEPRNLLVALSLIASPCWLVGILLFKSVERPFARHIALITADAVDDATPASGSSATFTTETPRHA